MHTLLLGCWASRWPAAPTIRTWTPTGCGFATQTAVPSSPTGGALGFEPTNPPASLGQRGPWANGSWPLGLEQTLQTASERASCWGPHQTHRHRPPVTAAACSSCALLNAVAVGTRGVVVDVVYQQLGACCCGSRRLIAGETRWSSPAGLSAARPHGADCTMCCRFLTLQSPPPSSTNRCSSPSSQPWRDPPLCEPRCRWGSLGVAADSVSAVCVGEGASSWHRLD